MVYSPMSLSSVESMVSSLVSVSNVMNGKT